jgi:TatD DNase family protein
VVHGRDADEDLRAILREAGWGRGVLHCFSGGRDLLDDALELGWHISFAGMITFPKWDAVDLLLAVPRDRLLVETDSPYLAPVPHRGKRNEPAYVALVARRAAELRGEDAESLMAATTANAAAFYGTAGSEAA